MSTVRNSFGWLLLSLLLSTRLVDTVREVVLGAVPARYWSQIMEVPVVLIVAFACIKLLLARWVNMKTALEPRHCNNLNCGFVV